MAQAVGGTERKEGEEDLLFDLQRHLKRYNVPDRVFNLLKQDSITCDELTTFTNNDLERWCDENQLRTIERRRFINAVKSLPNAQASKPDAPKIVQVPIFLGNVTIR